MGKRQASLKELGLEHPICPACGHNSLIEVTAVYEVDKNIQNAAGIITHLKDDTEFVTEYECLRRDCDYRGRNYGKRYGTNRKRSGKSRRR